VRSVTTQIQMEPRNAVNRALDTDANMCSCAVTSAAAFVHAGHTQSRAELEAPVTTAEPRSRPTIARHCSTGRYSSRLLAPSLTAMRPGSATPQSAYTLSSGSCETGRDKRCRGVIVARTSPPMLAPPSPNVARQPNRCCPQPRHGPREVRTRDPAASLRARGLEDLGNFRESGEVEFPRRCHHV
jgi:hypothetical protein